VAAFLRNSANTTKELDMSFYNIHLDDEGWSTLVQQAAEDIGASLVRNTHLKTL
jgi:hypothetical protein